MEWPGWTAQWFVVTSCTPRRVVVGEPVAFGFDDRTVTVHARRADLTQRGGAPLVWFAATPLLVFEHPFFARTLPVDVAPDMVAPEPGSAEETVHPQQPAPWVPR